ncbi:MAG: hypothetical protein A3C43_12385 [Candidatus Schekmanbacteria bacterium RIFCSPHIGHO2_02_FULL_38_11]|nr:MAG: hypothetical protein A3C43_12385 [Candidatus Schekmanbacteria bacterium RIFCSPHIGHO2_02_FULL_38_11]
MPKKIAVLGGGCTGLAAGLRLARKGYEVQVIEKLTRVGGLAGGVAINGNIYEYGPHVFHTTDTEILNDIKSIMGDDLISFQRTITIRFLNNYFKFPLSTAEVFLKLPVKTVIRALISLSWNLIKGPFWKPKVENSETVLMREYGKVIYEIFFKSYIERVWGVSPSEFSPNFARQRIPRLNMLEIVDKIFAPIKSHLKKNIKTDNYVEKVEGDLYTTKKGFSLIVERIAEEIQKLGGAVYLDTEVIRINRHGNRVRSVEVKDKNSAKREIPVDGVISTIPVNETVMRTYPCFENGIIEAAKGLRFRALVFVGLVVKRPKVLLSSFMYFRNHSFNRITDQAQFAIDIKPKGSTILVAEISCGTEDRYWQDETYAIEAVISDLEKESILKRDEILESYVFRAEHAYPLYSLNYELILDTLLSTTSSLMNFETAGRQGKFQYINTHIAMKMGYEAADKIIKKLQ